MPDIEFAIVIEKRPIDVGLDYIGERITVLVLLSS